ncbi:thioredoxin domain-containing protein 6 [Oncorhynchus keta]|uniref:thioredoxin domain-containing protein 6 n=1 Tax=Oncorhynchus keta TaxID=8018 RepID=UPI00227A8AB5|nr:thioredoxin domain-containing protein 6 [Oncorhynchus keta]XP_052379054.1 thioredoxin domain-containing protein 6 [Oncorhynchus keta]XP_052379055.1 thioredoxin domain-containing protein 6 [Oncorhynchus keta]XP_052379056.1 thioredoxin domain-containing protein 6 [Oncorhynchus keta]XP_052379057.1 thioredoxin domain-containing protein 6 [Oncorhynchus keta]XP_052379058.1 thioredoxin domain-containing protein 6 [Oncorhynchus keta]XP_052379059.1 thioredoxin domain-containing protein 6 [Oncorhync
MAGKKKEVSLQASVANQEQWDEMLATKGLTVVDVYQQWCGPCRAVVSLLRKIKNELGDDLLHFATAKADSIDALERYRGKCEPTFLFYGGGEMVSVLRGANAPVLQRMVLEELAREKTVLEEGGERRVVKDEGLIDEDEEEDQSDEDTLVPDSKSYTVAIIKPNAVAHGKTSEIIMKIQDAGFEILAHEERTLSDSEARDFYQNKVGEARFEDLIQFMSSGPSHVLVVSQREGSGNVVPAWREFIGPADIEEARRDKPESLRAQYGSETLFNSLHGSEDSHQARRELAFFFPSFRTSSRAEQHEEEGRVERTLALIRPNLSRESKDEIWSRIHEAGFTVSLQREVILTEEQARRFYKRHVDQDYFPALLHNMTSGPVLALALARTGAVDHWRNLLGPKDVNKAREEQPDCLRAQFMVASEEDSEPQNQLNQLHGSASREEAEEEIDFFFPKQQTLAIIKPDSMDEHREEILGEIRAGGFSISRLKETVLSRDTAEEFYREHRDKPFFSQLVDFMCSGPCMLLVLTKENAVEEWRSMMGPTDPGLAQVTAPGSLRARFALDILHNSLHGSSNQEHAQEKIHFLFGDIITSDRDLTSNGELDPTSRGKQQDSFADLMASDKSGCTTAEMTEHVEPGSPESHQEHVEPGSPESHQEHVEPGSPESHQEHVEPGSPESHQEHVEPGSPESHQEHVEPGSPESHQEHVERATSTSDTPGVTRQEGGGDQTPV